MSEEKKSKKTTVGDSKKHFSQWQLMWRRFRRHRVGNVGGLVVIFICLLVILGNFIAPYNYSKHHRKYSSVPPSRIHFFNENGITWPYVYKLKSKLNEYYERVYTEDKSKKYPIRFLVKGEEYSFWGLFKANLHLFGTENPEVPVFLFGTDQFGRDVLSRILWGGRISLAIGPFALITTLIISIPIGVTSGYFGGAIDMFIQRITETVMAFPKLPLWLALAMVIPPGIPSTYRFFFIVGVFSIVDWTYMSRIMRGMVLSIREEDYSMAAKAAGASDTRVMFRHILPNVTTYLVVNATLSIPSWIIAEAAISYLGLGIREPQTSWGLLLSQANNVRALSSQPWLLIPGAFIVITVLAFNFLGDAIRDAADPFAVIGRSG